MTKVRRATLADLEAIMEIQRESYIPELVESRDVFAAIISAGLSHVAIAVTGEEVVGFALAHPSVRDRVHLLHTHVESFGEWDTLFIHDVSVRPSWRRKGVASALVHRFTHPEFTHHPQVQCIAMESAIPFWEKQGFRESETVRLDAATLESYGGGACAFMESVSSTRGTRCPRRRPR